MILPPPANLSLIVPQLVIASQHVVLAVIQNSHHVNRVAVSLSVCDTVPGLDFVAAEEVELESARDAGELGAPGGECV